MELTGQRERSLFSILILINAIRKINQNKGIVMEECYFKRFHLF